MSRALLQVAKSYRAHIPRQLSVRGYWRWFNNSDDEVDENGNGGKNGSNGNAGKYGNGGNNGTNGKPNGSLFLKKHKRPADIIADFENRMKHGANGNSNKGIWAKFLAKKERGVTAATALFTAALAYILKVGTYLTTKYIDQKVKDLETNLSRGDKGWITPTLTILSLSECELKYLVPMPTMELSDCTYGWSIEGLILTIRGENEEHEFSYSPKVPKKFRHGKVVFESLVKGCLVVSVKVRGYKNPNTQTEENFSHLSGTKSSHDAPENLGLEFSTFNEPIAELDTGCGDYSYNLGLKLYATDEGEDKYKGSTLTMRRLRDKLTLWTSDIADDEAAAEEETK